MRKAKFITAIRNDNPFDKHAWEHTDLLYEYRGKQYIVTKHNNGYAFDSLYQQHQKAQDEIDYQIEHENDPIPKHTGSAEEGFELFWEYIEGKGEE